MKKEVLLSGLLIVVLFISACDKIDISKLSDEDLERISEKAIVCNEPYIRYAAECCLDQNDNKICDRDERELTSEEKEKEEKVNKETPSGIKPPVEEPPAEPTKSQRFKDDLECLDTYEDYFEYYLSVVSEEQLLSLDQELSDGDKEDLIEGGYIREVESFTLKDFLQLEWDLHEKEYKACKKIKDNDEKDNCLSNAGRELTNYCICKEIKGEEERSNCFFSVGRILLDVRICEKATALNYANECSDSVYNKLATKNLDTSYCDDISTQEGIDDCYDETYRRIAINNIDFSTCEKIKGQDKKDECYYYIVVYNDKLREGIDPCYCLKIEGDLNFNCKYSSKLHETIPKQEETPEELEYKELALEAIGPKNARELRSKEELKEILGEPIEIKYDNPNPGQTSYIFHFNERYGSTAMINSGGIVSGGCVGFRSGYDPIYEECKSRIDLT